MLHKVFVRVVGIIIIMMGDELSCMLSTCPFIVVDLTVYEKGRQSKLKFRYLIKK
jgi:hypothetical protein